MFMESRAKSREKTALLGLRQEEGGSSHRGVVAGVWGFLCCIISLVTLLDVNTCFATTRQIGR